MKKKIIAAILMGTLIIGTLSGCGNSSQENIEVVAQSEETVDQESEEVIVQESEESADQESEELADQEQEELADQEQEEEAGTPYYEEGRACLYGLDGKEIDLEAACTNFEKALEMGKTDANFYLGVLYYCYNYPERDFQIAKSYFEAAGDNPYAQILLGEQYYYGTGVEEDETKGLALIDATIEQGYIEGFIARGDMAKADEDYSTALECYTKASESEEPLFAARAIRNIGDMYWVGNGVEQDYVVAREWYEKAADLGNSDVMISIGFLYTLGYGVEQDYVTSMEWYEKAADLGNSEAMVNIGYLYDLGLGVEQDYAAAMEWFNKAADLGNSNAMEAIGDQYEKGLGVEQDSAKAQEWYDKAEAEGYE